jgi:hypothetical protein
MIQNRSVPPISILPHLVYSDIAEAIAWLTKVFGFTEDYRYGDLPAAVNPAVLGTTLGHPFFCATLSFAPSATVQFLYPQGGKSRV